MRAHNSKRTALLLLVIPPSAWFAVLLPKSYRMREALTFVGAAAILVFFVLIFTVLGMLFHEAGRKVAQFIRKARSHMSPQEELAAKEVGFPS